MPHEHDIVPDVRSIAVLKAGGLGDVMFALPALEALRAAYPSAELTLLTSRIGAETLGGRPPADRVLVVPPFEGAEARSGNGARTLEEFRRTVRREPPDLALQLHGGGANSNPLVLGLGARVTAGLRAEGAPALDRTIPYVYLHSEVLRCLEAVSLVGARAVTLEPRVAVASADVAASLDALPADERPLVVLHPGAGDPRRRWPAARFAEVGSKLAKAGARVAVTGTSVERALTAEVAAGLRGAADLGAGLSMSALIGLLSRAAVVVANDSGPLHLASAVGGATVGVYWCGNVVNAGPASVARHRIATSWRLACPVCGADCTAEGCAHDASFVAEVPVAEVVEPALGLLAAARGGREAFYPA